MAKRFGVVGGATFVVIGLIYLVVQQLGVNTRDLEGGVLLLVLGVAMAFAFTVLLRGSRDL